MSGQPRDPNPEPMPRTADEAAVEASLRRIDRRRFLGTTAAGIAGLALPLAHAEKAFAAHENAQVTLDAILITILSAPLGSVGSSSWTVTSSFASTFSLQAAANSSLTLTASVTDSFGNPVGTGTFKQGGGSTFTQSNSSQVTNAITINNMTSFMAATPAPGAVGNTLFLGIAAPTLNFRGNTGRLLYHFVDSGGAILVLTVGDLEGTKWASVIGDSTRNAWLAQYPLLADPTGSTLVKPRFKKRYTVSVSAGVPVTFTVQTSDGTSFTSSDTASVSAEITQSTGFMDGGLSTTFMAGNKITLTMTSVQEITATRIIKFTTVLQRTTPGTFLIFRDRVFKTWMIADGGPPAISGQPVVSGFVLDASGMAVSGAIVALTQGTQVVIAGTDPAGKYTLATPPNQAMFTGPCQIVVGAATQNVNVVAGTAYYNFAGVNPAAAQGTQFQDSGLIQ